MLYACKNTPSKNHGPIVLGDSTTIVTADDPDQLKDLVTDLKPVITHSEKDSDEAKPEQPKQDTAKDKKTAQVQQQQAAQQQAALPNTPGLKAEFKDISVLLPNVTARQSGNPNLKNANGAVYTLVSGNINGNLLRLTGNVTKVSQRYQSIVVLKYENASMPLDALTTTTNWEQMKGSNNVYHISGLDGSSLDYPEDANANTIRNAVTKAAQRRRMNRKKAQEWINSVHHVRAANQKPLVVTLRSVMWKIDGKDASGRPFSKQIRIDIPM